MFANYRYCQNECSNEREQPRIQGLLAKHGTASKNVIPNKIRCPTRVGGFQITCFHNKLSHFSYKEWEYHLRRKNLLFTQKCFMIS